MDNHNYCRLQLKLSRMEAIKNRMDIDGIKSHKLWRDEYAVFSNVEGFEYAEYSACCSFDARCQHINKIIDKVD